MVLVNLLRLPGLSQQELAKRCLVAKIGISMRLTRMVGEGLLKREADATDARVRRLRLTLLACRWPGRRRRYKRVWCWP